MNKQFDPPKARPHYILPLLVSRKPIWNCELSVNTPQVNLLTVQVDSQGLPIPSYRKWCNRLLCSSVITLSFPLGKSRIQISLLEYMIMWVPSRVVIARSETFGILSPPRPQAHRLPSHTCICDYAVHSCHILFSVNQGTTHMSWW